MEKDEWLQLFVAEQPLFKQHGQMERFVQCRDIIGIAAQKALTYGEEGIVHCLFTREDFERMREDGKKLLDNLRSLKKEAKRIENYITVLGRVDIPK